MIDMNTKKVFSTNLTQLIPKGLKIIFLKPPSLIIVDHITGEVYIE